MKILPVKQNNGCPIAGNITRPYSNHEPPVGVIAHREEKQIFLEDVHIPGPVDGRTSHTSNIHSLVEEGVV